MKTKQLRQRSNRGRFAVVRSLVTADTVVGQTRHLSLRPGVILLFQSEVDSEGTVAHRGWVPVGKTQFLFLTPDGDSVDMGQRAWSLEWLEPDVQVGREAG